MQEAMVSGKGNEAYEKLDREIGAKYGHLFRRVNHDAVVKDFAPAPEEWEDDE